MTSLLAFSASRVNRGGGGDGLGFTATAMGFYMFARMAIGCFVSCLFASPLAHAAGSAGDTASLAPAAPTIAQQEAQVAAAGVAAGNPQKEARLKEGSAPPGYCLVWGDEFNELALDARPPWSSYFRSWNTRHLAGNGDEGVKLHDDMVLANGATVGTALRQDGRWGNRTRFLHDPSQGTLKLRAFPVSEELRPQVWGFPYVASMISADLAPGQVYGYWEIRARINAIGPGHHLAFWLLPDDGSWPPEVDIFEVVGPKPTEFSANLHLPAGQAKPGMTFYQEPPTPDGFHTFAFEWTPTTMRWLIDGKVIRSHANYLPAKPLHPLISWEIGSNWPGKPDQTTPWPAEAEIDYIRVYKKRP